MKKPSFREEKKIWKKGYEFVIGVDEVGRGSFAGPVVAGAVMFKRKSKFLNGLLLEIDDSKLVSAKKRVVLEKEIKKEAIFFAISTVGVSTINKIRVGKATQMAIRKVIKTMLWRIMEVKKSKPHIFVLVDGFHIKYIRGIGLINQKAIIKGDRKSISIAAASIIAKVYRDRLMRKLNRKYPCYGFSKNKGYGTKFHQQALKKYGLTEIHRTSFNLKKFLNP